MSESQVMRIKDGFLGSREGIKLAMWCTENPTLLMGSRKTVANKYRKEHKAITREGSRSSSLRATDYIKQGFI